MFNEMQLSSTVGGISKKNKQRNGGLKMGLKCVNVTMYELRRNMLLVLQLSSKRGERLRIKKCLPRNNIAMALINLQNVQLDHSRSLEVKDQLIV